MKRFSKNKQGFTLIEMVLVIAIILILAAVLIIGIGSYIQNANKAASKVSAHNSSISSLSGVISKLAST